MPPSRVLVHRLGETTTRGRTTNIRSNAVEKDNADLGQYDLPQSQPPDQLDLGGL